jgi:type VI secretion system protein ImpC
MSHVETTSALIDFAHEEAFLNTTANSRMQAMMEVLQYWVTDMESNIDTVLDKTTIDSILVKIDHYLSQALDKILHHPHYQELESLWRGLAYLVKNTDYQSNCELDILDVAKTELIEDFSESATPAHSFLYQHVYQKEYDTPGGKPYSVMISPFQFNAKAEDVRLLANLSQVSAAAHCPFLGNISPAFFGKATLEDVLSIPDLSLFMQKAEYIPWNALRETEDSRYLGMLFSRFLLRQPYGEQNPTKKFHYTESAVEHDDFLWGSSTFAFAANMADSFKQYGWSVQIRGPQSGGMIYDLPLHHFNQSSVIETQIPTEAIISETEELQLSELGFIPLSYYKDSSQACFFSANSLQKPKRYRDEDATANSLVNARLPYIFLASRLGHYIKVIQRENIGAAKDHVMLERELNDWLQSLVTKMVDPSPSLMAKRPLREGEVRVSQLPGNPGFYKVDLIAIPHFQVEGLDVRLTLVSKMPKGDN